MADSGPVLGMWLQLVNALAFWPVAYWLFRRRRKFWLGAGVVVFVLISILTLVIAVRAPHALGKVLVGAPDGSGRALATFTYLAGGKLVVKLQIWRLSDPGSVKAVVAEISRGDIQWADCTVEWDDASKRARLVSLRSTVVQVEFDGP